MSSSSSLNHPSNRKTMADSKYARVLVYIRKHASCGPYKAANFCDCIVDQLGLDEHGLVECNFENNCLNLQVVDINISANKDSKGAENRQIFPKMVYRLKHPEFCPIKEMNKTESMLTLPPEISKRGVDVGVVVVLESGDGRVLMTRRASHMRTFPGVWVPPGGHVEVGESLEEAMLRELQEETGLTNVLEEKCPSKILGLWESVYPPLLHMGHPKRHHIVVYMYVFTSKTCTQLQQYLKLSPEEVDACTWLTQDMVNTVVYGTSNSQPQDITITTVNSLGVHVTESLDSSVLKEKMPMHAVDIERISTGSRFALALWLEMKTKPVDDPTLVEQLESIPIPESSNNSHL